MHESLKTDLHQFTMIAAQFYKNLHKQIITCEAFVRKLSSEQRFLIMVGTEEIRNFLLNLKFNKSDIKFLKTIPDLKHIMNVSNFAKFLEEFRFTGDFWSMAEGEVVFAGEPLIRITGTLPEVQIAETFILSVLNHDIRVASKAARIVLAARGKPVLEFSSRRTHHNSALSVARSAYLTGFTATSNVEASRKFGIPLSGMMSHMWVMTNDNERKALELFNGVYKDAVLLIDTYDTINGAKIASDIPGLYAVRLDSGNIKILSKKVREILNNKGHNFAKIIVSGDLNEYSIDMLSGLNIPIDCFIVGNELTASKDTLDCVYKAVYDDSNSRPLIKLSPNKVTLPGKKQVYLDQRNGIWCHLLAIDGIIKPSEELIPLLDCCIKDGKPINDNISLEVARRYCNASLLSLHPNLASLMPTLKSSVPVVPHVSIKDLFEKAVKL